jgi:hypothetical protein
MYDFSRYKFNPKFKLFKALKTMYWYWALKESMF